MKKQITVKSKYDVGDIVSFCKIKCKVIGFKYTAEFRMLKYKDQKPKLHRGDYMVLSCKVLDGETPPKHWNADGTIYPLDNNDVTLFEKGNGED